MLISENRRKAERERSAVMYSYMYEEVDMSVLDTVRGMVVGIQDNGLKILLENGETAFAFFGGLKYGTKVLCQIRKKAAHGKQTRVAIDSVDWDGDQIAWPDMMDGYEREAA